MRRCHCSDDQIRPFRASKEVNCGGGDRKHNGIKRKREERERVCGGGNESVEEGERDCAVEVEDDDERFPDEDRRLSSTEEYSGSVREEWEGVLSIETESVHNSGKSNCVF